MCNGTPISESRTIAASCIPSHPYKVWKQVSGKDGSNSTVINGQIRQSVHTVTLCCVSCQARALLGESRCIHVLAAWRGAEGGKARAQGGVSQPERINTQTTVLRGDCHFEPSFLGGIIFAVNFRYSGLTNKHAGKQSYFWRSKTVSGT